MYTETIFALRERAQRADLRNRTIPEDGWSPRLADTDQPHATVPTCRTCESMLLVTDCGLSCRQCVLAGRLR